MAGLGIEARTSDLRVCCPTDCVTRPGWRPVKGALINSVDTGNGKNIHVHISLKLELCLSKEPGKAFFRSGTQGGYFTRVIEVTEILFILNPGFQNG